MVETEVSKLERGTTELNRPVFIEGLVGNHRVRIFESRESLFGSLVRDELGATVFKRLTSCDVVEVVAKKRPTMREINALESERRLKSRAGQVLKLV